MFKTLLILLCIYWAWKLFRKLAMPASRSSVPPQSPAQPPQVTTELVKDPICNTYIEKTSALYRNGQYFCSETCAAHHKEKAA